MKKAFLILTALVFGLSLAACGSVPPQETQQPTESQPADGDLEEPQYLTPRPGCYVISSVGENGNISFFGRLDPANGYIRLEEDHTGIMLFDGTEAELTWDDENIYWGEETIPCMYTCDYDPELEMEDTMLALFFMDSHTSVIFRPVEENA